MNQTNPWKVKREKSYELVLAVAVFALVLGLLYAGIGNTATRSKDEGRERLEDAVRRAVVQCYAIEGMYPPDIDYLKDNYGLVVNEKEYIVDYQIFASNIMPSITILEKTWR